MCPHAAFQHYRAIEGIKSYWVPIYLPWVERDNCGQNALCRGIRTYCPGSNPAWDPLIMSRDHELIHHTAATYYHFIHFRREWRSSFATMSTCELLTSSITWSGWMWLESAMTSPTMKGTIDSYRRSSRICPQIRAYQPNCEYEN